jgi:hypothetical protein
VKLPGWTVLAAYQAAWCACVAGGARGASWPGLITACAVLTLALVAAPRRARLVVFCIGVAACGAVADASLAALGWIYFPIPAAAIAGLPLWMVALWLAFAPCLPLLAAWLTARPALAAALGAVGGPLAYWGASRFGAVAIAAPTGWLAIAAEYALLTPLACVAAARAGLTTRAAASSRG